MCAIVGAAVRVKDDMAVNSANMILRTIWQASSERGRDGAGWAIKDQFVSRSDGGAGTGEAVHVTVPAFHGATIGASMLGNLRAEPTTEYVKEKSDDDQQPYSAGAWTIVHNGTIANDRDLRTGVVQTDIDSAAIAEHLDTVGARTQTHDYFATFVRAVRDLKGSFAILAVHHDEPGVVYVAANYRPVWWAKTPEGVFFASSRDYFPPLSRPQMLRPYSIAAFSADGQFEDEDLLPARHEGQKALVVCSGGLDSVVSATYVKRTLGYDVHLIHFLYGSRAEGPEVQAVKDVAAALGCELTLFPLNVYSKGDSPLLDSDAKVAGGEAGAEFAHEWVPARNLLLLSVATAFAEARGIETIVLGNNLEEAGAYPDNEPEFIARFNDLLPFAVGDGKRMRVIMPVGNLMKHEIVALGHSIGAPMNLTWSCYRAGSHHCGTCGPCYMRRKAFEINKLPEVIEYAV